MKYETKFFVYKNELNTIIFIQDEVDFGYTAYVEEMPHVLAEGDTMDEARNKLFELIEFLNCI